MRQWILPALNDLRVTRTSGVSFASFSKKWEGEQKAGILIYHKVQFLKCMVERVKNGDNRSIYWGETEDTSEQDVECGVCGVQYFARIGRVKKLQLYSKYAWLHERGN